MLERFRAAWTKVIAPIAALFVRLGVSPDVITVVGTLGVCVGALVCFPNGWLWQGVLIITAFVFADMVDGQMARSTGRTSDWGAFLDSSLDRLGDGAVFGGIVLYFVGLQDVSPGESTFGASMTLWALVTGQLTSYVRAKAESLGFTTMGGLAARADRMLVILLGAFLAGVGVPFALEIAVTLLALGSSITVVQRIAQVRRQSVGQVDA